MGKYQVLIPTITSTWINNHLYFSWCGKSFHFIHAIYFHLGIEVRLKYLKSDEEKHDWSLVKLVLVVMGTSKNWEIEYVQIHWCSSLKSRMGKYKVSPKIFPFSSCLSFSASVVHLAKKSFCIIPCCIWNWKISLSLLGKSLSFTNLSKPISISSFVSLFSVFCKTINHLLLQSIYITWILL